MEKIKGNLYHLSHIDLDGYGCQLLTTNLIKNVFCFNSDYGKGIKEELEKILILVDEDILNKIKSTILITDLNLVKEVAEWIDEEVNKRKIKLILIDHHESGKEISEQYDWYIYDKNLCATKATYFYLKNAKYDINGELEYFSNLVNVYDLWQENDIDFKKSKLLSFVVFNTSYNFPKEVKDEKRKFILHILKTVSYNIYIGKSISKIEEKYIPKIKKSFLCEKIPNELYSNKEILLEDKYNYYVYELMKKMDFPIITINNIKIKVFYGIDGGVFQNIASIFNDENDNSFDCCMNILKTGKISLRSKGSEESKNVSLLSETYFNGGGHFNASGGQLIIEGKKEFSRTEVIEYLKSI